MLKSLLPQFIIFPLGAFAFYYPLFSLRAPFPSFMFDTKAAFWASIIASFFTWIALNKYHGIRHITADLSIAKKMKFEDGRRAVVSGRVKSKGPLLKAPCSGMDCVAYRYKASHYKVTRRRRQRSHTQWIADFRGHAMTPSLIKGSMRTVSILAEPDCVKYPEGGSDDPEIMGDKAKVLIREHLNNTDFGEEVNDRLEGRDALTKQTSNGPGDFRVDTRAKNPDKISNTHRLREMVIREGDTVLISGVYNSEKDGIGPGPNSTLEPLQITPGGEAALKAQSMGYKSSIKIFLGLAAATSIIYFIFFAVSL